MKSRTQNVHRSLGAGFLFLLSMIAAGADPEGVLNGWDFRGIKEAQAVVSANNISIQFTGKRPIAPSRFKAIPCQAESWVKLKIWAAGTGTLSMGCHSYNRSNHWLGQVKVPAVAVNTKVPELFEFNVRIPVSAKDEVKTIRPFLTIQAENNFTIGEFEYTVQPPQTPKDQQATGGEFPKYFERLAVSAGDFPLRLLPSEKKLVLDFVERPFHPDANKITALRLKLIAEKEQNIALTTTVKFQDGKIKNFQMPLPDKMHGDYRVEGEYLDHTGKILCQGQGYSHVSLEDLDSGWYVVGGMRRNAHLKNIVRPYPMGQKIFPFAKYPFREMAAEVSAKPLPGFMHPAVEGNLISVIGRKYHWGNNGLLQQVEIRQPEPTIGPEWMNIFAAPMTIEMDGKTLLEGEKKSFQTVDHGVEFENTIGGVLSFRNRIEQDGAIRLSIRLRPDAAQKIGRLTLKIPLKADQATLFHEVTDVTYRRLDRTKTGLPAGIGGHAGKLSSRKIEGDLVWRSLDCERNMPGSFNPMVWLGNEDRGFCYFADSDRGWLVDDNRSCLEIERKENQVILNINFINRIPAGWSANASWTIGLLATPVKEFSPLRRGTIFPRWATLDKPFYDTLTHVRKIIEVGAGDPRFTAGSCSILPKDTQTTRKMYEDCGDLHGSRYMEYWCSDYMNLAAPELAMYFGEWSAVIEGTGLKPPSNWFKPYSGFNFPEATWISCRRIVPSYLQFRLWCFEQKLKTVGPLTFYEDNMHLRCFFDPAMNYGYYRQDGKAQVQFDVWSVREYYRKIAEIFRRNGVENLSGAHSSAALTIPAFTYCTYFLDGEQPARYSRGPRQDYVDVWSDTDYFRAGVLGRQFGISTIFMSEIDYTGKTAAENEQQTRAWLAVMLPHDVSIWDGHIKDRGPVKTWHKIVNDLDFLNQPPRLYPYWGTGKYKVVEHNNPELLATLYRQNDRALLILGNFGEEKKFTVKLNLENLKLRPQTAIDLEAPEKKMQKYLDAQLTIRIPRHDYRLVLLK